MKLIDYILLVAALICFVIAGRKAWKGAREDEDGSL
jgi:hypothetical protein